MDALEQSIMLTVSYFDLFRFATTKRELLRGLIRSDSSVSIFSEALLDQKIDRLLDRGLLQHRGEYYFLPGREYLIPLRKKYAEIASGRWRRLRRVVSYISWIPWLRGVIVFGSLAFSHTNELSDLDIFCVAQNDRVWLTRLSVLGILALLGKRRSKFNVIAPNKVCPNHFVAQGSMAIPFHNTYNAITYLHGKVIYDIGGDLSGKFFLYNPWISEYITTNGGKIELEDLSMDISQAQKLWKHLWQTPLLKYLSQLGEITAKKIQYYILGEHGLALLNQRETRVCDSYLAFHDIKRESQLLTRIESLKNKVMHNL